MPIPVKSATHSSRRRPGNYYHTDHLGTPLRLTDATGAVVLAADYQPFGKAELLVNTVENNLRFPGQYFDSETGLQYNLNRYYDLETGRYLTPDSIGLEGGVNVYFQYVHVQRLFSRLS